MNVYSSKSKAFNPNSNRLTHLRLCTPYLTPDR